ncbi:MAG: methionine adenosyltransferase [Opitutae bacterium]|nr:methionine adenosyltransferase [Opitutae bacterium]MCD8298181.1 methionine adenosyltransferase [Opitutae bacterium]
MKNFTFTSESVGAGHPDKVADLIADSILDACIAKDPHSRVACETLVKDDYVILAGEITTTAKPDYETIVRKTIRDIGYVDARDDDVFHADSVKILNFLGTQSPDIAQGVDAIAAAGKSSAEQGAGDQGIMFGYATDETPELMPAPIMFAHKILFELDKIRHDKANPASAWLRPDCKSQVTVLYDNGVPAKIDNVVLSTQHTEPTTRETICTFCENLIRTTLPSHLFAPDTKFFINPTGKFVTGGPHGDAGVTGRKIIVDTYGGMGRHGGGAFSGKDPSKVDRAATYMCRWVAKNIVAAGFAKKVEIQISYAIGEPEPTSIFVNTAGTNTVDDDKIVAAVKKVFSFKPATIIRQLDLLRPIYVQTTNYGHFTKAYLPWEQTNKVDALRAAIA